ncbi:hypothetical protein Pcinc_017422 [Petrolisthes cinctipes]|uniref:Ribosomal protein L1 n=1 Tax=Petrolisthes cinctipes TaxID=88211 RepID=A0AAE1KNS3_PETCI|nr:hypothetical protein Pcinc_017422 [Petrolisthes cinctipes]
MDVLHEIFVGILDEFDEEELQSRRHQTTCVIFKMGPKSRIQNKPKSFTKRNKSKKRSKPNWRQRKALAAKEKKLQKIQTKHKETVLRYYSNIQEYNEIYKQYKIDETQRVQQLDKSKLVNEALVEETIRGLRGLAPETTNNVFDASSDGYIMMQVTLYKLPTPVEKTACRKSIFREVPLPNSLVTENMDVLLITDDQPRKNGAIALPEWTIQYYKTLLHKKNIAHLVTEIVPLKQLKQECFDYEGKRSLYSRADVVLCHKKAFRGIPRLLGKIFYRNKKIPITVTLNRPVAAEEIQRALKVSHLCFYRGTCASLKVGRLSQTDEEIKENIMAAVRKVASVVPGKWFNVQNLSLKLHKSVSIPIYVNLTQRNMVKKIIKKPSVGKEVIRGPVSTINDKFVSIFEDGNVFVDNELKKKPKKKAKKQAMAERKYKKEEMKNVEEECEEEEASKKPQGKKTKKSKTTDTTLEEMEEEVPKKRKRKMINTATTHQEEVLDPEELSGKEEESSDSESDEDNELVEELELEYLKRLDQARKAEKPKKTKDESEADAWDEDSEAVIDSDSDLDLD